jgi:hypothetical protein
MERNTEPIQAFEIDIRLNGSSDFVNPSQQSISSQRAYNKQYFKTLGGSVITRHSNILFALRAVMIPV